MFDRKKFKQFAKIQLKKRWAVPIAMTLITGIVITLFQVPSAINILSSGLIEIITSRDPNAWEMVAEYEPPTSSAILDWISSICILIFSVAQYHVYIIMSRGPEPVSPTEFFSGFNLWLKAIFAGILNSFWTMVWSMLFIIPGIVKSIAYSQMFFIIAEYPSVSATKAMRISIAITQGHKSDLFILWFSFIGWSILCLLSCGIGFLWLIPYINMTQVNSYHWLMKQALERNIITPEDLGVQQEQL